MVKFLRKFMLFVLILLLILFGVVFLHHVVVGSQYAGEYNASICDKINRLKSINEPKIILVGHSNLSFGIHSEIIEKELGMPVVNLGLHGGLGNAFHERIAKLNINKGDIVVICHSTFSDANNIPDPSLAWITYDNRVDLLPLFRLSDFKTLFLSYSNYLKASFKLWIHGTGNMLNDGCYSRNAFNAYGDVVVKPKDRQMDADLFFKDNVVGFPQINDTCVNRLNKLNRYCQERGASMVVAGYPIAYGKYANFEADDLYEFKERLDAALDCDVISDYTDYVYPYDYFYDTVLHLTDEGARIRTLQLITDIKAWRTKH